MILMVCGSVCACAFVCVRACLRQLLCNLIADPMAAYICLVLLSFMLAASIAKTRNTLRLVCLMARLLIPVAGWEETQGQG